MQVGGDRRERRALVGVAVQQQGRHPDAAQHVAQVGVGEAAQHGPHRGRAASSHDGLRLLQQLRRGGGGEQPGQVAAHPLLGRQLGLAHGPLHPLAHDLGRQRPGPPGVGRRQHQRPRHPRMPPVQLEGQPATPRQAAHVGLPDLERGHQPGQAVGVVGQPARLRRVVGSPAPRRVPGHHGEVVAQPLQLPPPVPAVPQPPVRQHQRRPAPRPPVGDPQPVDLDVLHGQRPPWSGAARRQRAMVVVTMAKPKPRSSTGAQTTRGPRITAGS